MGRVATFVRMTKLKKCAFLNQLNVVPPVSDEPSFLSDEDFNFPAGVACSCQ